MTKDKFINYLEHPEQLDQHSVMGLKEIIEDYPCFAVARILYLRNLRNVNSYKFESELVRHAAFISDRSLLFRFLNEVSVSEKTFELLPYDESAFTSFFDRSAENEIEPLHFAQPTPFNVLNESEALPVQDEIEQVDLIGDFIAERPSVGSIRDGKQIVKGGFEEQDESVDDSLMTETLADIYVSQGLFDEALNAYVKLSLKFPEKSSYFATQIEKVKKLISKKP